MPKTKNKKPLLIPQIFKKLEAKESLAINPPPKSRDDLDFVYEIASSPDKVTLSMDPLKISNLAQQEFSGEIAAEMYLEMALNDYCSKGDLEAVCYIVEELHVNPNSPTIEKSKLGSVLHATCDSGQYDILKYLLDRPSINAHTTTQFNWNLLISTINGSGLTSTKAAILKLLSVHISNPRIINRITVEGITAVSLACYRGDLDLLKILMDDFKANPNSEHKIPEGIPDKRGIVSVPFLSACFSNNIDLLNYFMSLKRLKREHLPLLVDKAFLTICRNNHKEMASHLIHKFPQMTLDPIESLDVLLKTLINQQWDMFELLISNAPIPLSEIDISPLVINVALLNASNNIQKLFFNLPVLKGKLLTRDFKFTSKKTGSQEKFGIIIKKGTLISKLPDLIGSYLQSEREERELAEAHEKQKVLDKEASKRREIVLKQQKEKNALQAEAERPKSPEDVLLRLESSVQSGDLCRVSKAIILLREFNKSLAQIASSAAAQNTSVDINSRFNGGDTLLHIACRSAKFPKAIIKMLIREGARTSLLNDNDETPFFIACKEGSAESVLYFLDNLPDYQATPNKDGITPVNISLGNANINHIRYRLKYAEYKLQEEKSMPLTSAAVIESSCETMDGSWIKVEGIKERIAQLDLSNLEAYFYESSKPKHDAGLKKMRRQELILLGNRVLDILNGPDSKSSSLDAASAVIPSDGIPTIACILGLLLKYEAQYVLSSELLALWEKKAIIALNKIRYSLDTLSDVMSVFSNSATKPSSGFIKIWCDKVQAVSTVKSASAVVRSIRACAKLSALFESSITLPKRLIDLIGTQQENFSPNDWHAYNGAAVIYPSLPKGARAVSSSDMTTSEFHKKVLEAICKNQTVLEEKYLIESEKFILELATPVDILIDRGPYIKKLIIQVDGPCHFNYVGDYNSSTLYNTKLLEVLGYEVIRIPFYDWDGVNTTTYIRNLLSNSRIKQIDRPTPVFAGDCARNVFFPSAIIKQPVQAADSPRLD